MKLKTILATTFLLLSFGQIFSQNTKTLDSVQYKIDYPSNWFPSYMGGYGAELYIFTPLNDSTDFQENISLSIQKDLPEEINNLENYTNSVVTSLDSYIKELKLITNEKHLNEKLSYSTVAYTGLLYGEKTNVYQRIYFKNNKIYILTFTFKPESDASYKEKAIKAFDSFEVK